MMEEKPRPYFDREITALLKGTALVLMFFHHFFTFPAWITVPVSDPFIVYVAPHLSHATRICVAVFVFLTGYLDVFRTRRGFSDRLRKITDFLLSYWTVYLVLLLFAVLTKQTVFDPNLILYELFGLKQAVMPFSWYVPFYLLSLFCLHPVGKQIERGPVRGIHCGILLPTLLFTVLAYLCRQQPEREFLYRLSFLFDNAVDFFPVMAAGTLVARFDLFRRFDRQLAASRPWTRMGAGWRAVLLLILAILCCAGRALLPRMEFVSGTVFGRTWTFRLTMDLVYAPILVWSLARLFAMARGHVPLKTLAVIGRYSLYLWFWHDVFFKVCAKLTQPILYAPVLWPLILVWGLAICFALSWLTDIPVRWLCAQKNRLLFPEKVSGK
ncbi:MAG: acyltransferase [Clostridiales bacterium]|nr:acyltransferase [Clostridiales bacterium]